MANNKSGFDRAKIDGEPALKRELERAPYDFPRGILQHVNLASEQFDKMLHIDLVAHYMIIDKNSTDSGSVDFCFIDLKDPDNVNNLNSMQVLISRQHLLGRMSKYNALKDCPKQLQHRLR